MRESENYVGWLTHTTIKVDEIKSEICVDVSPHGKIENCYRLSIAENNRSTDFLLVWARLDQLQLISEALETFLLHQQTLTDEHNTNQQ